jgi:hypothetical protein
MPVTQYGVVTSNNKLVEFPSDLGFQAGSWKWEGVVFYEDSTCTGTAYFTNAENNDKSIQKIETLNIRKFGSQSAPGLFTYSYLNRTNLSPWALTYMRVWYPNGVVNMSPAYWGLSSLAQINTCVPVTDRIRNAGPLWWTSNSGVFSVSEWVPPYLGDWHFETQ